jgi:hypothetical protein
LKAHVTVRDADVAYVRLHSGRMKLEDAGFDWKILGPDVTNFEYVTYTCDQVN